jgi:hypothetical protein
MKEATNINFLGLVLDKYMNWKNCVEKNTAKYEQYVLQLDP